jgi:cobalamin biosynthesis Mg chelatase CobN
MEIPSSDVVKKAQSSDDPSLAHLRHRDEKIRQAILESRPRSTQTSALKKVSETSTSPTQSEEQASTTPWSVIVVSIVAALGLVWLWLKRRSRV